MIKITQLLLLVLALFSNANAYDDNLKPRVVDGCYSFTVGQGTGCQWTFVNYAQINLEQITIILQIMYVLMKAELAV
jgi:hypothetical protein